MFIEWSRHLGAAQAEKRREENKREEKSKASIVPKTSKWRVLLVLQYAQVAADVQWPQCQERRQGNKPQVAPTNKLASASALLAFCLGVLGFFSNAALGRGRAGKA